MSLEFKIKKVTSFRQMAEDSESVVIPASDLTFTNGEYVVQLDRINPNGGKKEVIVKPGVWRIGYSSGGTELTTTDLKQQSLLESAINTQIIKAEADRFYNKLHIYDMLGEAKARKLLLYSDPGCGKSSAIAMYANGMIADDSSSAVIIWPTARIESDDVLNLMSDAKYENVSRLLFVMEDIGGGEREGSSASRSVDSSMLDMLDGIRDIYRVPTFIIATTNYPQNLLSALADRPGRFDLMLELKTPSADERLNLVRFFAKRELSNEEVEAISKDKYKKFSVAHLKEAVIRHYLTDISIEDALVELLEHKKKFEKNFESNDKGLGW